MSLSSDLLIIGAGPAGSAAAIFMARAGWRVTVMEKEPFPRQKVCGECVAAGGLDLIDELGVGPEFRRLAGPELQLTGWLRGSGASQAQMPQCADGNYRFGRAIGRDRLDALLLDQARAAGVTVLQPATALAIHGGPGRFLCEYRPGVPHDGTPAQGLRTHATAVVVDAHGSWERGPMVAAARDPVLARSRGSDLFAFKARFLGSRLEPGFLPVFALQGGYGGVVVSDEGRTTLACCVRRDVLRRCRRELPGVAAGPALEHLLRFSCRELDRILEGARPESSWLSVGPLRPGIRIHVADPLFRVGNAAGETHPLIGQGIAMALRSAAFLASELRHVPPEAMNPAHHGRIQQRYNAAWRRAFLRERIVGSGYAHLVMRPLVAQPIGAALRRWPQLLTHAAQWAGKAQSGHPDPYSNAAVP